MNVTARHFCRNTHCRTKLKQPVENFHHGFCCKGYYSQFYGLRCVVCEKAIRRRTHNKRHCGHIRCRSELRKYPHVYAFPSKIDLPPTKRRADAKSAHSTGTKMAHFDTPWDVPGSRPKWRGLREWWWGDPLGGTDLSLYDQDGLTLARIVLVDGAYELRSPITWPRKCWPDLESAKRGAELIALSALPPDKATVKALERKQPMKPPLNRPWPQERSGNFIIIESKVAGDPGPLPACLRRAS
jgi:hypothetical protein